MAKSKTNLFASATKIATPATASKSDRREVEIDALSDYASVCAVIQTLTAIKETLEGDVKEEMLEEFIAEGNRKNKRPENFLGVSTSATASCELKKRTSSSVLKDEEVAFLRKNGVAFDTKVTQNAYFVINPEYAMDNRLLAKVSEALMKVAGLPEDFIQRIEEQSVNVTAENAIDTVFEKKRDKETTIQLLSMVSTLAVKPKLRDDDISEAFELVSTLVSSAD